MKRILKSRFFFFVLGAILFSGIGIVFAYSYAANTISFHSKDISWTSNNVKQTLDNLRNMSPKIKYVTSNIGVEGNGISYTYTVPKKGKVLINLYTSTGKSGGRWMNCKKNNVEVTNYVEKTSSWPLMRTYLIDVKKNDSIYVFVRSTGKYGDESYVIYFIEK